MSITDELSRIQRAKASLKASITNKGVEVPDTALISAYSALVDQIQTGGGTGGGTDVIFIDFDGTVLHQYSKDDFLSLTEMPSNPDRTAENLTAEGWNWTLADAKAYVEKYGELTVGQTYHTTDGTNYFYLKFPSSDTEVTLKWQQTVANGVVVDWGDGSATETNSGTGDVTLTHTYPAYSELALAMKSIEGNTLIVGPSSGSLFLSKAANCVVGAKLAKDTKLSDYACSNCRALRYVSIPNSMTDINDSSFSSCYSLPAIVLPNSVTSIGVNSFSGCYTLHSVGIPNSVTTIGDGALQNCHILSSITIPEDVTELGKYVFSTCRVVDSINIPASVASIGNSAFSYGYSLQSVTIPASVTSVGSSAFQNCYNVTLDLSSATKVPTASGDIFGGASGFNHPTILVPSALLAEFQSATNWATYAGFMKGV